VVVNVFLFSLEWCDPCGIILVLHSAGACAERVCLSVECRAGSLPPGGEKDDISFR
jgi:hypothetical protein